MSLLSCPIYRSRAPIFLGKLKKSHDICRNQNNLSFLRVSTASGNIFHWPVISSSLSLHVSHYSTSSPVRQAPRRPPSSFPSKDKIAGGLATAASASVLFGTKSKSILAALKLTKFASLGSMLLSVGAYTTIYGFPYATGMVGLLLVHESGHALTMKKLGVPFSPMIFVPFLGASVAMKRSPRDAYEEALIALGGPVLGTAGSLVVWGAACSIDSQLLFALADFGFMINLINLIPVGMLDGGRIGAALSPYAGVVGVGTAGSLIGMGYISNPIFYLVTLAGGYQTGMRLWKGADVDLPKNYYYITDAQRIKLAGGYFGLLGVLCGCMALNESLKKSPERIRYEQRANGAYGNGGSMKNVYQDY